MTSPAVQTDPATVEGGCDVLCLSRWKRESQNCAVIHGGWDRRRSDQGDSFDIQSLRRVNGLRHIRKLQIPFVMNKTD